MDIDATYHSRLTTHASYDNTIDTNTYRRAALYLAARTTNAGELADLLDMCGLTDFLRDAKESA